MNQPVEQLPTDTRLRLRILGGPRASTLGADVLRGLCAVPKSLPPKHFYDDRGSLLFERICETPEYYQTRAELQLLQAKATSWMDALRPTQIVELGSGSERKARVLLDAAERCQLRCSYLPFDVSEGAVRQSARLLLQRYPWLTIEALVGDYEQDLEQIPRGDRRLFVFLGGTIGNFEPAHARDFLRKLRQAMTETDHLLLGTDLVKAPALLDRAYNDQQGLTADFNKNVLRVINRQLNGRFDPDAFRHVAFFAPAKSQVEMHLESLREQTVAIAALDLHVHFEAGERLLTEISRKFTRASTEQLLGSAGLALKSWHEGPTGDFGLSLSAPA